MDDKYIVAIEIGSSKIRGALASIDPRGVLNILAVQDERTVDSVRYGHVKNVEEVNSFMCVCVRVYIHICICLLRDLIFRLYSVAVVCLSFPVPVPIQLNNYSLELVLI